MTNRYSIAEARDQLTRLIHDAEKGIAIELTRRGKPVAALVSTKNYHRFRAGKPLFWEALVKLRTQVDLKAAGVGPGAFTRVRDRSKGREVRW